MPASLLSRVFVAAFILSFGAAAYAAEPPAPAPAPTVAPATAPVAAPAPASKPAQDLEQLKKLEKLDNLAEADLAQAEQLKFFELNGYYRVRTYLFHQLDLGVFDSLRPYADRLHDTSVSPVTARPNKGDNTVTGANMRLRLSPTLNLSEQIRLKMDMDLLDNVVLGSTPDTYRNNYKGQTYQGLSTFAGSQTAPKDALAMKRVWAEVMTPVGQLAFGRMPLHWGTGMFMNAGKGIDDDYGDTIDRIKFTTKLFEHEIFFGVDFVNQGITNTLENGTYYGQPKDFSDLDDAHQLSFGFLRSHTAAETEERLENNGVVVDYGLYNAVRWQNYTLENTTYDATVANSQLNAARTGMVKRNLKLYMGDAWLKLLYKRLHLEFEASLLAGTMNNAKVNPTDTLNVKKIDILQYGMVLKADYRFLDDALFVGFEWGLASGDPYPGFGIDAGANPQYGKYQRTKDSRITDDHAINNFRFSRAYGVDLLLFKEILGTVSDATYFKPSIMYNVTPSIGMRLDYILSLAMEPDSTPSYYHMKFASYDDAKKYSDVDAANFERIDLSKTAKDNTVLSRKTSRYLGSELDFSLFYKSYDGWGIQVQYGIFFPGQSFGYWSLAHVNSSGNVQPSWIYASTLAQSAQCKLWVEF